MRYLVRSFGHAGKNLQLEQTRIKKIILRCDKVWIHMVGKKSNDKKRKKPNVNTTPKKDNNSQENK